MQNEIVKSEQKIKELKAEQEAESGTAMKQLSRAADKLGIEFATKQATLTASEDEVKARATASFAAPQDIRPSESQRRRTAVSSAPHGQGPRFSERAVDSGRLRAGLHGRDREAGRCTGGCE